jgi:hypothetical protein
MASVKLGNFLLPDIRDAEFLEQLGLVPTVVEHQWLVCLDTQREGPTQM